MRFGLAARRIPAAVHGFVGEAVGVLVVFTERVADFHVFDLGGQALGLVVKLPQLGMTHLIDALHLANHQFGIADDLERVDLVRDGGTKSGQESVVLGVVVGLVAEVLVKLGNRFSLRAVNDDAI